MSDNNVALGYIELGGVICPLAGGAKDITFQDLARFQPRVLFGNPGKDDNDLLSSWQMGNFSGGHGVAILEATDEARFEMGTLYARFPGMITKPPFVSANSAGALEGTGNKVVLGEMWSTPTNEFYVVYMAGLGIRRGRIDGSVETHGLDGTYASAAAGTLTSAPVGKGVAFQGTHTEERFFVPQGNNGYAFITGDSTLLTGAAGEGDEFASPEFRAFTVYDNKLVGVTTGGRLYRTYDGTTWTAYDLTFQLSKSYRVRNLVTFVDRQDEPCVYVITDRDIWQFDPNGPELFRIDHEWSSHPRNGYGTCVFRGALYVSVGMAVWRYTGGTWMPIGLDRDFGLPAEYQGYVSDLFSGNDALYAVVQADDGDDDYGGLSGIYEFNGSGWQTIWTQTAAVPSTDQYHAALAQTPFTMGNGIVTQSDSVQTIVFGTQGSDDHLYTMPLSLQSANPRAGVRRGQMFAAAESNYHYLETGEFDAGMFGYTKIANAIQLYLEEPLAITVGTRDTVRILANRDRSTWEEVLEESGIGGRYSAPFGTVLAQDHNAQPLYSGASWERIKFRYEVYGGSNADKPIIITNAVFNFIKTVEPNDSWQIAIDCRNGSPTNQMTAQQLMDYIDSLTSIDRFTTLKIGSRIWRVWVSQNGGTRTSGDAQMGIRNLAIVQIPTTL
jgi:hypothetical protein